MEPVFAYIKEAYNPLSILVYGSYADGSNNADSDFDALVITQDHEKCRDVSRVGGIQLDLFIYPAAYFGLDFDCGELIQLVDSYVAWDTDGRGAKLRDRVLAYAAAQPFKDEAEIHVQVAWCRKMLLRAGRGGAEGLFRWHWLLTDSLEIYCDVVGERYRGPKKALRWMEQTHPEAFARYTAALVQLDLTAAERWVEYLTSEFQMRCEQAGGFFPDSPKKED